MCEAQVEDQLSQERFTVRADAFVNATGPFSDQMRQLANPGIRRRLRLSKGIHILLPLAADFGGDAVLIPKTEDGRVIFAIPWQGRLLVGTTDHEATPGDEPVVKIEEIEYLLRHLNRYLRRSFRADQVLSGMAGLRPLVSRADERNTKKMIRDHEVEVDEESGLISVLGGKWTTYRAMAEDTVNVVQQRLKSAASPCKTRHFRLSGSEGYEPGFWHTLVAKFRISPDTAQHLSEKFGTHAIEVLELARTDRQLAAPIVAGAASIQGGDCLWHSPGDGRLHRRRAGPAHRPAMVQLATSRRGGSGGGRVFCAGVRMGRRANPAGCAGIYAQTYPAASGGGDTVVLARGNYVRSHYGCC